MDGKKTIRDFLKQTGITQDIISKMEEDQDQLMILNSLYESAIIQSDNSFIIFGLDYTRYFFDRSVNNIRKV